MLGDTLITRGVWQRRCIYIAPPSVHVATPAERASRALCLHASTSLHLQRAPRPRDLKVLLRLQRPSDLQASRPPRPYAYSTPPELHNSVSSSARLRHASSAPSPYLPYLHVCSPAARLQSFTPLYLQSCTRSLQGTGALRHHTYTSPGSLAARLQSSMPSQLHVVAPTARLQNRVPPFLHVATPATRLQSSMPPLSPRRCTCIAPPEFQSFLPPRLHDCSAPAARLQSSRASYLHVCTPAARLQSSKLYATIRTHPQVRSQRASRAPEAPCLHASTSLHLQRASKTPYLHSSTSLHLQLASRSSMPP